MDEQQPKKMGRPLLEIDEKIVENLAMIHCTMAEIAATVGCSVDTLENRFSDIIRLAREKGKMSLKRMAWRRAEKGSDNMLGLLLDNHTDVKLRPRGIDIEPQIKDVNVTQTIENDIVEVRNLLNAKPKAV